MRFLFFFGLLLGLALPTIAIPNALFGALARNNSPLNGEDLTDRLLAPGLWAGGQALPGDWLPTASVAGVSKSYLLARPKILGLDALLIQSSSRKGNLEELQVTFADAGSFFGYLDQRIPEGLSKKEAAELVRIRLDKKQKEFSNFYRETSENLLKVLRGIDEQPDTLKRGRSRELRAEFSVFHDMKRGLVLELLEAKDRLLRLTIRPAGLERKGWLDVSQESVDPRDRLKGLSQGVRETERGDRIIEGVEIVPQGFRPYCGLNSLVMVSGYLGLHLDEDWLAVAGKFQNTGSAAGSDMMSLYGAVAREARFRLKRTNQYDHESVRRSIRAGLPVIVWRRWDQDRDRLHTLVSNRLRKGGGGEFPKTDLQSLPSKKKRSPVHASIIVGYNDGRSEVIFLESWEGLKAPRRMPVSEMKATTDFLFAFTP